MNRSLLKHVVLLLIMLPVISLTACKEMPTRHKKAKPQYDIEKASKSIEHYMAVSDNPEPMPVPAEIHHPILDLADMLKNETEQAFECSPVRSIISQFPSEQTPQTVRVVISLKGIPKNMHDDVEHHILNLLNAHAPQPWELSKSSSIDSHETVWGRVDVEYKKQVLRLKRASKTAPLRSDVSFSFKISFSGPRGLKSSWDDFHFNYHDEIAVSSESAVTSQFWQNLEKQFPTLTAIDSDLTAQWLRTQGLSPLILTDGLSSFRHTDHQYFETGCLLSHDGQQKYMLRQLQSPYSPPQNLDVSNVMDMKCMSDATFIVSSETPLRMALYYQPRSTSHAWKSQLKFADSIREGDLRLHIDDDLVCLYTGLEPRQNRGVEIQCLDRRTGLMRWQTKRLSGALRGFAADDKQIVFANDQALFAISREGEVMTYRPLQTSSRLRQRLSCQLQNRLIFMMGPGQFVSWNLDKMDFDWQTSVFESDFIHCSQQNTLLFSEVGGYILAYDVENNKPLWKYRSVSTPLDAFSYGNIIYLLQDKAVIALDRATGQQKAQIPLPWMAQHFIQIGAKLYLDTRDTVYTWR